MAVEPEGLVMEQGTVAAFENTNIRVKAQRFIFAAGSGNETLAAAAGAPTRMQRRPLEAGADPQCGPGTDLRPLRF